MDRVRFGRALGIGARQAAKTLVAAVDAATAENPSPRTRPEYSATRPGEAARRPVASAGTGAGSEERVAAARFTDSAVKSVAQARQMKQGVARGGRQAGQAIWSPFVRLSGVLWLEVSGFFFGLFALMALGYMWKLRGEWHTGVESHRSLLGAAAMFALFGYFCVSNFVRAKKRERGG
jgi:hypothetical protein